MNTKRSSNQERYRVVTFNGGRGARGFIRQLLDSGHDVTCVVNAYDDGRSTGELRRAFNILGPSDIAKTAISMSDPRLHKVRSLIEVLESRFPVDVEEKLLHSDLQQLAQKRETPPWFDKLSIYRQNYELPELLVRCAKALVEEGGRELSGLRLKDMAFRNLILVGAYLLSARSWTRATLIFNEIVGARGTILLNSEENRWLVAIRNDGVVERTEAGISDGIGATPNDLYLLRVPHARLSSYWAPLRKRTGVIRQVMARTWIHGYMRRLCYRLLAPPPKATLRVLDALTRADIIIYCPGTLYSSILPSLMTRGIPHTISRSPAQKLLVLPLAREHDTEGLDDSAITQAILDRLGANDPSDYINCMDAVLRDSTQSTRSSESGFLAIEAAGIRVVSRHIRDAREPSLHDPVALERTVFDVVTLVRQERRIKRRSRGSTSRVLRQTV